MLTNAYKEAVEIIQAKKEETQKLAEGLLVHETLSRDEVLGLLRGAGVSIDAREAVLAA